MKTVQKYTCCVDGGSDRDEREYMTMTPETAAEYYAEDVWDTVLDGCIGEVQINVDDEDGNEFEVAVVISRPEPRISVRKKN